MPFACFTLNVIKVQNLMFCHKYQNKNNFRCKNENINKKVKWQLKLYYKNYIIFS